MSDDYAGADYNEAESDLGLYESDMEVSGYDAVTTTQDGMRVDEYLKDSGMTIDTVGDAQKAQEHNKKENEKAADARAAIREVFSRAHQHVDDHKYNFKIDGLDVEISHGDLKDFMKKQAEQMNKKMKTEKDAKKRAQMEQDFMTYQRLIHHMETEGPLNEDQLKEFSDVLDRYPEEKAALLHSNENVIALKDEQKEELIKHKKDNISIIPDPKDDQGVVMLQDAFTQNVDPIKRTEVEQSLEEVNGLTQSSTLISMSNNNDIAKEANDDVSNELNQGLQTTGMSLSANLGVLG
ncbi:MAG: hypothetical protein CL561_07515 [Alphaproteobacteria bacterium]|nr:hypothetical protein [Alphaproteobacteria bacterium]